MNDIILGVLIILAVIGLYACLRYVLRRRHYHSRPHHISNVQYVDPGTLSQRGWKKTFHPPRWVRNKLTNAPEYEPEQGIHFYPYLKGKHYEYCLGDTFYKRRLAKR
jgi:hypothetical protein